jgi:two-component system response regulator AtoC
VPDSLLLIEDEELLADELARHFRQQGLDVTAVRSLEKAEDHLLRQHLDPLVVVSDMSLPDGSALDLLEKIRSEGARTGEWLFLTAYGTVPDSVRALRLGAYDFLEKPCPSERLDLAVAGAARSARAQRRIRDQAAQEHARYGPDAFVGSSAKSQEVRHLLARLAQVPVSALIIEGETGTGKGLAARILHHNGLRGARPLVEVNCAAMPQDLLESELFGHEAGAFTGAKGRHRGLIEQAQGGTLFLDEVGEMNHGLQAKLLKAVEERRMRRLGGEREFEVDARVVAASNRDLRQRVAEGEFREDLYHRLSVLRIELPPLRERLEDLEELVHLFIGEYNSKAGKRVRLVSDVVWEKLRQYRWPGNVRELRNVVERCVLLSEDEYFPERWLQLEASEQGPPEPERRSRAESLELPLDGSMSLDEMEKHVIEEALDRARQNVTAAARTLGTTRQTLRYRIEKHGIKSPGEESAIERDSTDQ